MHVIDRNTEYLEQQKTQRTFAPLSGVLFSDLLRARQATIDQSTTLSQGSKNLLRICCSSFSIFLSKSVLAWKNISSYTWIQWRISIYFLTGENTNRFWAAKSISVSSVFHSFSSTGATSRGRTEKFPISLFVTTWTSFSCLVSLTFSSSYSATF